MGSMFTIGIESEKPILLLLVGHDIAKPIRSRLGALVDKSRDDYMNVVVHSVPYISLSSSSIICTFWPLGVLCVMR